MVSQFFPVSDDESGNCSAGGTHHSLFTNSEIAESRKSAPEECGAPVYRTFQGLVTCAVAKPCPKHDKGAAANLYGFNIDKDRVVGAYDRVLGTRKSAEEHTYGIYQACRPFDAPWEKQFDTQFPRNMEGQENRVIKAFIKEVELDAEKRGIKQGADDMVAVGLKRAVEKARAEERERIVEPL